MPVIQKDLIQQDKEMTQVKCERQYEWGSALGKFLDLCHVFDFFFGMHGCYLFRVHIIGCQPLQLQGDILHPKLDAV